MGKKKNLGKNTELGEQNQRSRERRLRRSDWNAEKKNKNFRSQGKKGRGKGGEHCVKRCGEAKLRIEKWSLDVATETSTDILIRAGLVNRSGQNQTANGWAWGRGAGGNR